MQLLLVNSSFRENNQTQNVVNRISEIAAKKEVNIETTNLTSFDKIFTGEFINSQNANKEQLVVINQFITASHIVFVIPTYHSSFPGSLKNFIDLTGNTVEMYENKVFSLVSSSGNVESCIQFSIALNKVIGFKKLKSVVLSYILRADSVEYKEELKEENIKRVEEYLKYISNFELGN